MNKPRYLTNVMRAILARPVYELFPISADWFLWKYEDGKAQLANRPFEELFIPGNLALTEGKLEVAHLIINISSPTAFSAANAYLGVGDSATVADVSQTGLIAASNKFYQPMDATFPSIVGTTITWQATFADGDAQYTWNELTIANGSSNSAVNLNRKVAGLGTKSAGMVWTLQMRIAPGG